MCTAILMRPVDHCIETLRLSLMCQADIGVFTYRRFPEYGLDEGDFWPDFSSMHVCRNFDTIRTWAIEHAVAFDQNV
jgi:hypothetical protein